MNIEKFYATLDGFFAEKKIDKAELFLKETLREAEAEENFGLIIAAYNELGGLYRVLSRYDEGMPLYEKALESLRRIGDAESENYATTLINYATILSMSGCSLLCGSFARGVKYISRRTSMRRRKNCFLRLCA